MTATMEIPFALGEKLWSIGDGVRQTLVTCDECAGTRVIEMIKGNGVRVSLDCGQCCHCYDPPHPGFVSVTIYEHSPTPFVPRRAHMSGDEFAYSESSPTASSYSFSYAKDLFRSKEDCKKRCVELNAERTKWDEERKIAILSSRRKSAAFSASYWGKKVIDLRNDLARAEAMLSRCKAIKATA